MIAILPLLSIPASLALKYLIGASAVSVFVTSAVAVAALAEWIRRSTDQLAARVGPALGGLLTISFGSIAELVLGLFVLLRGQIEVVQAQIAGSILGTSLFGLGLAAIIGGATRDRQRFKPERAGLLSSLMVLVVIALLLPAIFDLAGRTTGDPSRVGVTDEEVSLGVSIVLLLLYLANLVYTLITHRDVFSVDESNGGPSWSLWLSLSVLIGATAAIALEAELLSAALEGAAGMLHLSPIFLGVIVLALIGTAGDIFAAAWFAHQDRMGLVLQICIGSAIQVALVLAPLLVLVSWALGRPMNLVFSNPLHLFAVASTAFIVNSIARDGETTWFEGVLLVGFMYFLGSPSSSRAPVEPIVQFMSAGLRASPAGTRIGLNSCLWVASDVSSWKTTLLRGRASRATQSTQCWCRFQSPVSWARSSLILCIGVLPSSSGPMCHPGSSRSAS